MKIAVVHPQSRAIDLIRRLLDPSHRVVWTASSGQEALQKCLSDKPDLMLMGLRLPDMTGAEAVRQIMEKSPCGVIMVGRSVHQNASLVFEAMGHGALDAAALPGKDGKDPEIPVEFSKKISMAARYLNGTKAQERPGPAPALSTPILPLALLGASTGGPKALADILARLPRDFQAALVIVQHVDPEFSSGLADWLDKQTPINVRLARDGDRPAAGTALLSDSHKHLVMDRNKRLAYRAEPLNSIYKPSIDVFFDSAARNWPGARSLACLLTGMGKDGALGLGNLFKAGWHTIAQDQSTSVVYGMPKAAVKLGAARQVLPIDHIPGAIRRVLMV